MLEAFVDNLTSATPTPEVRPQVVRSPISARGAPRSLVVRSPILAPGEVDAAVPVTSTAPVPAPVASTVAAVVPALDEAGEEARLVPNAGENVVLEGALGEAHSSCLVLSCLKKSY